jgi:hypothetical protein
VPPVPLHLLYTRSATEAYNHQLVGAPDQGTRSNGSETWSHAVGRSLGSIQQWEVESKDTDALSQNPQLSGGERNSATRKEVHLSTEGVGVLCLLWCLVLCGVVLALRGVVASRLRLRCVAARGAVFVVSRWCCVWRRVGRWVSLLCCFCQPSVALC